jgi:hypothetical protein
MDKAYIDFDHLYSLHNKEAYFVVRAKGNNRYQKNCFTETE